jgi:hypothetical protein
MHQPATGRVMSLKFLPTTGVGLSQGVTFHLFLETLDCAIFRSELEATLPLKRDWRESDLMATTGSFHRQPIHIIRQYTSG